MLDASVSSSQREMIESAHFLEDNSGGREAPTLTEWHVCDL